MKRFFIQSVSLLVVFLLINIFNPTGAEIYRNFQPSGPVDPAFLMSDSEWADSVLNSLNLEEKIGQLMMVASYSYMGDDHRENIARLIEKYNIGGVIFMKGHPVRQAKMTNYYQSKAKTPLMIAADAEWGLSMRLDSTITYPRQMMLGAIQDDRLIYQMGKDIGSQLKRIGVHVNFAPVVDVNNNPLNPVINSRSFGEDPYNVAAKAYMYARGLEDAGILACYKHFPGHGDTDSDSHYSLPVIKHSRERLDSIELVPFRDGIRRGIPAIMSAHMNVPVLDSTPNLASSLSERVLQDELMGSMGFRGLIFTDALGMNGVARYYKPGELEVKAFNAGNDILLMPKDAAKAINYIKREVKRGRISEKEIDARCKKILMAKYWLGLNEPVNIETDSLYQDLNDPFYLTEKNKFISHSLTLLKNNSELLPLREIHNYKIASLSIGSGNPDLFGENLKLYGDLDDYYISEEQLPFLKDSLYNLIEKYNTVIISIQNTSQWPGRNYGIYPQLTTFLNELEYQGNLILSLFGSPYAITKLGDTEKFDALILAYDDSDETKKIAAQSVFGAYAFQGKIPVSVEGFGLSSGINTRKINRLSYGIPESVMLSSERLKGIDSIVHEAIEMKAIPGSVVLVARKGRVIYHKAYGYQSYQKKRPVRKDDIYDLASLTKITATLPMLMKLEDEGRFSTENTLGDYLNFPDSCNKSELVIKDILSHQSGLPAWIPFYYKTLEPLDTSESLISTNFTYNYPYKIGSHAFANRNIVYRDSVFEKEYSPEYPIKVAENLFLRKDYRDTIINSILDSELMEATYRYSDLGYYLFMEIIENERGKPLYPCVYKEFYSRLGANTLGYLPLNRFPVERIAPTENDLIFRRQLLQGYVHDPGAAMLGGVAGHAGLFSNANDLAKMMQMYLNKGVYGDYRFLSDSVITKYSTRVYSDNGNRRALGFDKPEPDPHKPGPACESVSPASYGHSGFTGTLAWVDPEYDLIYIFLSNRIHPNQYNTRLIVEDIRTRIQQVIYDSLLD